MPIIKVVDWKLAEELNALGHASYIEKINGREVYCFIADENLVQHVLSRYDSSRFFLSDRMLF